MFGLHLMSLALWRWSAARHYMRDVERRLFNAFMLFGDFMDAIHLVLCNIDGQPTFLITYYYLVKFALFLYCYLRLFSCLVTLSYLTAHFRLEIPSNFFRGFVPVIT